MVQEIGNASLFTKFLFTIFAPLNPPPPNRESHGFSLEFLLKGRQTELRTLSQNCEQTLQKLRTNRIMNKWAFLRKKLARKQPLAALACVNFQNILQTTLESQSKSHCEKRYVHQRVLPALLQKLVGEFFFLIFHSEIWWEFCGFF